MISSTNTSTHVTTTYTYDYRNRLTEVTTGGTVVATYTYNALNQRIGVDDSGTQTWTVYDGKSADANPYADFSGSGNLAVRYLFGPGVVNGAVMSVILARTSSGTTAWYLTDDLGSVRDIVSSSGSELDHIVYDSFGNIVTETYAANGDRFKFAGMQYDIATGEYYDHARAYGSGQGRFSSQDPKGFAGGDPNLYVYADDAPTDSSDPSGMQGQGPGGSLTLTLPFGGQGGTWQLGVGPNYTWGGNTVWPGGTIAPFWTYSPGAGWKFGGPGLSPPSPDQSPPWPYQDPPPAIGPDPLTGQFQSPVTRSFPDPAEDGLKPYGGFWKRPMNILGPNPWKGLFPPKTPPQ